MPLLHEPFVPSPAEAMLLGLGSGERATLPDWLAAQPAA
jgi:hypothetical protein